MIVVGLAAIGGITYGLTKLKPAAPHSILHRRDRNRQTR